jgi:hypothetical protein
MTQNNPTTLYPLPVGYEFSTGPNGTVSVADTTQPGKYFSLCAWKQIELGRGLWADAHRAIFGRS